MALNLIFRLLTFSIQSIDLKIISSFRQQRENHKGYSSPTLETDQYQWCAEELSIPAEKVESRIQEFMHQLPLSFLLKTRYQHIDKVFDTLKEQNIALAIYSDYHVKEKLDALQLKAEGLFCSTDKEIQQLKPSAKAIDVICNSMNIAKNETILIGDRDDTDGESARLAGISFLKVDVRQARSGRFYANLLQLIKINNV
jgi:FMN phosphatase YigB (HAD superfamily)